MPRYLLLLNLTLLIVSQFASAPVLAEPEGIHVTGRGMLEVEPDMARLTLQVTREGPDATALKKSLDDVTRAVLKLGQSLRIAPEDITAAAVSIQPRYRRGSGPSVIDGVQASRTIAITLRDLERYGELMNGALELGVNSISGTQLDTSKRGDLEKQALELAMADAREAAGRVAAGFGVRAGRALDVSVGVPYIQPKLAMRALEMTAGDDFSAGLITIERDVQATFAIEAQ